MSVCIILLSRKLAQRKVAIHLQRKKDNWS